MEVEATGWVEAGRATEAEARGWAGVAMGWVVEAKV